MRLTEARPIDVRPLLLRERRELLSLLRRLDRGDWARSTSCPGWCVKDVALHIIGDDLRILSIGRDGDTSGLLSNRDRSGLIEALNAKNEAWVAAARGMSHSVICGLLDWTGAELDAHYGAADLRDQSSVLWASDAPVPAWLDIGRELTEHWLHQQQIRDAVDRPGLRDDEYLGTILRILVWAVPHHYRQVDARIGTRIALFVGGPGGGEWSVSRQASGWELDATTSVRADARIELTSDDAWRLFAGALSVDTEIGRAGDARLTAPFLSVRAFLV